MGATKFKNLKRPHRESNPDTPKRQARLCYHYTTRTSEIVRSGYPKLIQHRARLNRVIVAKGTLSTSKISKNLLALYLFTEEMQEENKSKYKLRLTTFSLQEQFSFWINTGDYLPYCLFASSQRQFAPQLEKIILPTFSLREQ